MAIEWKEVYYFHNFCVFLFSLIYCCIQFCTNKHILGADWDSKLIVIGVCVHSSWLLHFYFNLIRARECVDVSECGWIFGSGWVWCSFLKLQFEFWLDYLINLTLFDRWAASMPVHLTVPLWAMWSVRDFDSNRHRVADWTSNYCFVVPTMDTICDPIPNPVLAMVMPSWSSPVLARRTSVLGCY